MRPALVRIIDVGGHSDFAAATAFAESLIDGLQVTEKTPLAEIEFIRTIDFETFATALSAPATVVHVTGHGSNLEEDLGLWADEDRAWFSLKKLSLHLDSRKRRIDCGALIMEACDTGLVRFRKGMSHLVGSKTTYVGTSRGVTWLDGISYLSAFYSAFFRKRGAGVTAEQRGADAATRASAAYEATLDKACPYKVFELEPSKSARKTAARWE